MFCDQCHWYTRGEPVCPHCGAAQSPKKARDMFNLPGDVSVLDDGFIDRPLTDGPMPIIETSSLLPKPAPVPRPVPVARSAPAAPKAARVRFCGRCGTMECIGAKYCAKCGALLPQPK